MSDRVRQRVPILTEVGELRGRDAIYLDRLTQTSAPSSLRLDGQLNARLCTRYVGTRLWLPYELTFLDVVAFTCCALDRYSEELLIDSSLDTVPESLWTNRLRAQGCTHYVAATYDLVYEIVARHHELKLVTEVRPAS